MKKRLQGLVAGVLIGATVAGTGVFAYTNYIEAVYNNIRIVVDGKEVHTDTEPFISEGTTYLPVRAVAEALGKPVYWDGPNYTVYIGENFGILEYPTATIKDVDNIGSKFKDVNSSELTDNYGNSYSYAYMSCNYRGTFQTLLNMKYRRFKCTLYVSKGCTDSDSSKILIKTDGKVVYTSPEITKTSRPIDVDVDITGCNDFQIEFAGDYEVGYIADAGFYQ